jgi:hypothetical protein
MLRAPVDRYMPSLLILPVGGSENSGLSFVSCRHVNFYFNLCGGTLGTAATTGILYQPRMIGDGDCGEIGGMKISRGNRSTRGKPAPAPLCPPQNPHH